MPVPRQDLVELQEIRTLMQTSITFLDAQCSPNLVAACQRQCDVLGRISAALDTGGPLLRSPVNGGWYTEAEIKQDHEATERVG